MQLIKAKRYFMNLESLKEFATNRQKEIIDAVIKYGSQGKAAKKLEINSCTMSAIVFDKIHGEIQRHKVGIRQLSE